MTEGEYRILCTFNSQLAPSLTKTFLVTAKRMNALLCIRKCVFAPWQADFHPITSVSSSWVFSSDRVIMPGLCAARHDLASDQKGPSHKHVKGKAQERSRVGGVTLLLHLSGSSEQARWLSGEFDCSGCFHTKLVKTLIVAPSRSTEKSHTKVYFDCIFISFVIMIQSSKSFKITLKNAVLHMHSIL